MAKEYTVAQLEKILLKRKAKLESLIQQRNRLQKKLVQVEERILAIGGVVRDGQKGKRTRRRPKNAKTLIVAVSEILSQNKKGLSLRDLASKLLASGYKTASTNFQNTLYQCLYHNTDKLVHDAKSHTYRLK
jgi:hypothetical protein